MIKTISQDKYKVLETGLHDALINGDVIKDIPTRVAFVASESELAQFTETEPVGTIAIQYGFSDLWQLTPDRVWKHM